MTAISILSMVVGIMFMLVMMAVVYISVILVELNDAKKTIMELCYHFGECGEYGVCKGCPFAD